MRWRLYVNSQYSEHLSYKIFQRTQSHYTFPEMSQTFFLCRKPQGHQLGEGEPFPSTEAQQQVSPALLPPFTNSFLSFPANNSILIPPFRSTISNKGDMQLLEPQLQPPSAPDHSAPRTETEAPEWGTDWPWIGPNTSDRASHPSGPLGAARDR